MKYVILYVVSVALGSVGAWVISRWGPRLGFLDKANHRSSHEGVIPKGGGIGILAAFLFSSWLLDLPTLSWVCTGGLSLFSFYGDRREVPAKVRLCVQFVAAILLLGGLFYWEGRGLIAHLLTPFFSVFVVGTANYYNFMDGINGIAGVTGVVGFGLVAVFAGLEGANEAYAILALCMVMACVGFLPFNMPKARVFMGDVGSVLLGFVFGGLVVGLTRSVNDFVVLCAFMFPFYADELTTEYVRLRDELLTEDRGQRSEVRCRGEKTEVRDQMSEVGGSKGVRDWMSRMKSLLDWMIRMIWMGEGGEALLKVAGAMGVLMTPHRRHIYQLLANEMGIEHRKVSVGYGVLQVLVGIGALVLRGYGTGVLVGYLGAWFAGFWGFGMWVRKKAGKLVADKLMT